jgi:hypothetical protein
MPSYSPQAKIPSPQFPAKAPMLSRLKWGSEQTQYFNPKPTPNVKFDEIMKKINPF